MGAVEFDAVEAGAFGALGGGDEAIARLLAHFIERHGFGFELFVGGWRFGIFERTKAAVMELRNGVAAFCFDRRRRDA